MDSGVEGVDLRAVRRLWELGEVLHSVYLDGDGRAEYERAGLKGGWMRYFGARAAPLGAARLELVEATFYGFHPRLIGRAIPDAWRLSSPERAHEARVRVADAAIRRSLPWLLDDEAAPWIELLVAASRRLAGAGRPLYAAHASMAWPEPRHLRAWWAATLLREHRGDGHAALLVASEVGPCESLVWHAATGAIDGDFLRSIRGWDEGEWEDAAARLRERGWMEADGRLTIVGEAARKRLETETDRLAAAPWVDAGDELREVVTALGAALERG